MSDTPRTDALVEQSKPLDNLEAHNAMLDHARGLERRLREQDQLNGQLRTKLKSAARERDKAVERQHALTIEARGYHHSLMRCERDARRWQWIRLCPAKFLDALARYGHPTEPMPRRKELDLLVDEAINAPARRRSECSTQPERP